MHDDNVPLWSGRQLGESGYTYDFIDPVDLATNAASARPGRLFGDGPDYRALIIDNRSSLDVNAARAIVRDVDRGLPVVIVGTVPSASDGLADPTADDAVVRHAMSAVLASPRGVHVATEDDVPAALEQLGVDPSARFTGGGGDLQKVHRRDGADDYWWIYNPTNRTDYHHRGFRHDGRAVRARARNAAASGQPEPRRRLTPAWLLSQCCETSAAPTRCSQRIVIRTASRRARTRHHDRRRHRRCQ